MNFKNPYNISRKNLELIGVYKNKLKEKSQEINSIEKPKATQEEKKKYLEKLFNSRKINSFSKIKEKEEEKISFKKLYSKIINSLKK